jgi:hypothetical protein
VAGVFFPSWVLAAPAVPREACTFVVVLMRGVEGAVAVVGRRPYPPVSGRR